MRILIADDQPLDRSVLKLTLEKWDYDVIEAADGTEAMAILKEENAPTLAILDWMMPGISGPDICSELRRMDQPRYTYILLLTSKDEQEDLVAGLQSGADDYIVKPVDVHELQVRLRAGRRITELQEELIATREELRVQATRDFLTGIWNRGMITEKLDAELHRASRRRETLGVIMCDIDHFKEINDTFGHSAGDAVLVEVANRMQSTVRKYDAVGRFGGEEFLIVVPDADADGVGALAERIRRTIADRPIVAQDEIIPVTVSLGITTSVLDGEIVPKILIDEADQALYRAKRDGRNRVEGLAGAAQA